MVNETNIALANLLLYPVMNELLGKIIRKRLDIENWEIGMLTGQLLDNTNSQPDLKNLENVLRLCKKYCKDLGLISQESHLLNEDIAVDNEIINMLAEIKAFEFLYKFGFKDIAKLRPQANIKTVDFSAIKSGQHYAVEVTRMGLAQAERKQPIHDELSKPPSFSIIDSKQPQNRNRIGEDIYDEIVDKHPQIKEFCQSKGDNWKGILVISTGRDYFVANRYENKEYEFQPSMVPDEVEKLWKVIKNDQDSYKYLDHLVITRGKDIGKIIVHPNLKNKP